MKILLTGGAGFIGSHIAQLYHDSGHQVLVIDNLSSGDQANLPEGVELVKLDITDSKVLQIMQDFQPDAINHQAAQIEVRTSVDDPMFDAQVNIVGTLNVLEAARKTDSVKKIVFASSGGAIYAMEAPKPTAESAPARPVSPYGVAKLSVEHYLYYYQHVHQLPYVALRYANVYGPRQNPHGEAGVVAIYFQRVLSGQKFAINGNGQQTRDFVFVKDVARANLAALSDQVTGPINIGTAQETSINHLVRLMAKSISADPTVPHRSAKKGEQQRSCLSVEYATKILGWQPEVDLAAGLQHTAEYFQAKV